MNAIRIDKYLWAIRLFKTRTLAGDACKSGHVKIDEIPVKASREVKVGDIIDLKVGSVHKRIEVVEIIKNRLKASLAIEKYNDITPQEEMERQEMMRQLNYERRDRGVGRPTKKDRREIERLKDF